MVSQELPVVLGAQSTAPSPSLFMDDQAAHMQPAAHWGLSVPRLSHVLTPKMPGLPTDIE